MENIINKIDRIEELDKSKTYLITINRNEFNTCEDAKQYAIYIKDCFTANGIDTIITINDPKLSIYKME